MANRRMFAKSVTGSARFLRMPMSARLLYYDLGMQADDEGVVEAFAVMRMTGASEDDLRVLAERGFVKVLNEDLVTLIADWKTNNLIKKDRYNDSVYHALLEGFQNGTQMEPTWNPSGTQMEPQVRLGKDSIGKDSIGEGSGGYSEAEPNEDPAIMTNGYISSYINLSPTAIKELDSYRADGIQDDVIRWAVDAAIDNNKRSWSYVRAILNRCMDRGYKTLPDVLAAESEREKQKAAMGGKTGAKTKADLNYQHHEYTEADYSAPKRTAEEEEAAYQQALLKYMERANE